MTFDVLCVVLHLLDLKLAHAAMTTTAHDQYRHPKLGLR